MRSNYVYAFATDRSSLSREYVYLIPSSYLKYKNAKANNNIIKELILMILFFDTSSWYYLRFEIGWAAIKMSSIPTDLQSNIHVCMVADIGHLALSLSRTRQCDKTHHSATKRMTVRQCDKLTMMAYSLTLWYIV